MFLWPFIHSDRESVPHHKIHNIIFPTRFFDCLLFSHSQSKSILHEITNICRLETSHCYIFSRKEHKNQKEKNGKRKDEEKINLSYFSWANYVTHAFYFRIIFLFKNEKSSLCAIEYNRFVWSETARMLLNSIAHFFRSFIVCVSKKDVYKLECVAKNERKNTVSCCDICYFSVFLKKLPFSMQAHIARTNISERK